jgi:hypothetical protein
MELNELCRLFDHERSGQISYYEFLDQIPHKSPTVQIYCINEAVGTLDVDATGQTPISNVQVIRNPKSSEVVRMGKTTANRILANLLPS